MQNVFQGVSTTVETLEQINNSEIAAHLIIATLVIVGVISAFLYFRRIYSKIDKYIDKRIEDYIHPSVTLLAETVEVVKNLERNTAEISATLSILKEILLSHKDKS